jgi:predicted kinase
VLSGDAVRTQLADKSSLFDRMRTQADVELRAGHDVTFDACNVYRSQRRALLDIAARACADTRLVVVEADAAVCMSRQDERDHPVPRDVIARYAAMWPAEMTAIRDEDWGAVVRVAGA